MFCIYFGKDDDLKDRKRKSTTKVKYFIYPSFRTDNYRSHLKLHKYKWEEYWKCSFEEKKLFFNFKEESIINRLESHFESNKNYKSYVIDSDVLDNIVSYLMFEENDFESKMDYMSLFNIIYEEGIQYKVTIWNFKQFTLCVKYISWSCTLRQVVNIFNHTKYVCNIYIK